MTEPDAGWRIREKHRELSTSYSISERSIVICPVVNERQNKEVDQLACQELLRLCEEFVEGNIKFSKFWENELERGNIRRVESGIADGNQKSG